MYKVWESFIIRASVAVDAITCNSISNRVVTPFGRPENQLKNFPVIGKHMENKIKSEMSSKILCWKITKTFRYLPFAENEPPSASYQSFPLLSESVQDHSNIQI